MDLRCQLSVLEVLDLAHGRGEGDFGILGQKAEERLKLSLGRHCSLPEIKSKYSHISHATIEIPSSKTSNGLHRNSINRKLWRQPLLLRSFTSATWQRTLQSHVREHLHQSFLYPYSTLEHSFNPHHSRAMAEKSNVKEFPDIGNKLTAPTKKSVFERHKAEAEAKRQREEAETAAVYEDFVKSFDDEAPSTNQRDAPRSRGGNSGGGGISGGFSKRHFSGPPGRGGLPKSGPGSLGPPLSSLSRKREYDGTPSAKREGLFAFEDVSSTSNDPKRVLHGSDDEDADEQREAQERSIPKPTLRLSSLPPGTSSAALKAIVPPSLNVEGLRILPPPASSGTDRHAASAVITLAKDTPAIDIDTAVSALQNRYMGRGFYLSISRHLSSSASHLESSYGLASASSSLPFNARPIAPPSFSRGPGSGPHRGGFAPPSSYNSLSHGNFGRGGSQVQVTVTPPSDLKQLKLIHKTLEALLTHGPELEALLMSRKAVQNDVKWAWLWDSRSTGGVYYRWRLWDLLTGWSQRHRRRHRSGRNMSGPPLPLQQLFENGAVWEAPERGFPFEYTTDFAEIVSDSDYDSSADEDDSGDEGGRRRYYSGGGGPDGSNNTGVDADGPSYLNPLQKAKLTHLLARLPISHAKLRRGDVARVTAFAIQHAGAGAEEVVSMIIANVHKPYAFTSANPTYQSAKQSSSAHFPEDPSIDDDRQRAMNGEDIPNTDEDSSPAKLVALYLISDILSTSSTSGVRHAWRYRSLFEAGLRAQATFACLGRLATAQNWGRLRAEKWKRSVLQLLSLWEGWCVFPGESQEFFTRTFSEPPLTADEIAKAEAAKKEQDETDARRARKENRWRSVDDRAEKDGAGGGANVSVAANTTTALAAAASSDTHMDVEVDGDPMQEDDEGEDNFDGDPMSADEDENLDGEPMVSSSDDDDGDGKDDRGMSASDLPSAPAPAPPPPPSSEPAPATTTAGDRRAALAASIAAKMGRKISSQPSTDPKAAAAAAVAAATTMETGDGSLGAGAGAGAGKKRQRPRAEDMFASDEED